MKEQNSFSELPAEDSELGDIGICVFDNQGKYLYTNEAFSKIRGTTPDYYSSMTPLKMFQKKLIDKCILNSVFVSKMPVTDVQSVLSEDGTVLRKQLVTIYPILNEQGEIKNAIAYYRDMATLAKKDKLQPEQKPPQQAVPHKSTIVASPRMEALYAAARNVAVTDSTILITGETGTGKEVLAQYIHHASPRRNREMVVVDCASLPDSLIESELFGYEKGSFTGANSSKEGLIESADGSTLFLDEINSLPMALQGKLLRLLETKSIKRLGALKSRPVDFRLIAAANVDLLQCVADKTFRSDLYYRLNVIPLRIPPLREHREDIVPLVHYFEEYFSQKYGVQRFFAPQVYEELRTNNWVGNVRELKNMVERLVVMGTSGAALAQDRPYGILSPDPAPAGSDRPGAPTPESEREQIIQALAANGNHREKTAQALCISRRSLQYKLKKYGLN